jgi:orotidine-5'-phosphate decarboxylase
MHPTDPHDRLILALDVPTPEAARTIVEETAGAVGVYKIGLELIYAGGLELARDLVDAGLKVFLDAKLLDIDNTVAGAIRSIVGTGAAFATLHAYPKTMAAAVEARGDADLRLLAVTALTSMDDADLAAAGYRDTAAELVAVRARQAAAAGIDGIVASPLEVARLRPILGRDRVIVTPGVRPAGSAAGDQKRVATPAEAIRAGADYLVVGRPILAAPDRRAAAEAIARDIAEGLAARTAA